MLTMEYMPITEITKWPGNPKKHNIPAIKAQIRKGYHEAMVVDTRSGKLVAGHGRLETLIDMMEKGEAVPENIEVSDEGVWMAPFQLTAFKSDKDAEAFVIAANRISEIGGWDDEALNKMLQQFQGEDEDLIASLGYSSSALDKILAETTTKAARDKTPKEKLEGFENADIKQIVLFFPAHEYEATLPRLEVLMQKSGTDSHTELFLWMVDQIEAAG